MKKFALSFALVITLAASGPAQSISLSGVVRDQQTLDPLDSALVEIINSDNPLERYSIRTSPAGLWSLTLGIEESDLPAGFSLAQNYPNPFNPSTTIGFTLPHAGTIRITVHNILGQRLDEREFPLGAGTHNIEWRSAGAAGVLFYTVEFGGTRATRKMIQLDGGTAGGLGEPTTSGLRNPASGAAGTTATSYSIIASKLIYMPDTTQVSGSGVVDFNLETVHHRAFVFDLHNDVMEKAILGYQIGVRNTVNQSDLPRFRDGGMDAQMFALWTDWRDSVVHPCYSYTLQMADTFYAQVGRNASQIGQARTADEILQLNGEGKLAGILAIEGGHAIDSNLDKLRTFYDLGARYFTITWNNSLLWAVSAADSQSATVGLDDFGREVVRTLDSLGMLIDVSHTGIKTIWDILAVTKNPIIATHSGVRALNNHYRNLNDAQIDSIASRGGVIGVVFYPTFLSASRRATIDTVIRHIDYIRNRVGVDYIAIGSDFDGIETVPVGLEDVSKLPNLTAALLRRGYSISDVFKILGGNALRVFRKVCG